MARRRDSKGRFLKTGKRKKSKGKKRRRKK